MITLIIMLIDTHCHLDFPDFDPDRDEVIKRAQESGIACIINIGSSLKGSQGSLELSKKYDFVYASVGIHPHEADRVSQEDIDALEKLAKDAKVVAIGEIGLDYYKNYSRPENQKPLFISLLGLAKELDLPVVVHSRLAQEETLNILKQIKPKRVVVHCFSGDEIFLKESLDSGFFVSFTCNITYKKAENLRSIVKNAPLQRLLLETDAPFLPPQDLRGKRNEPMYVKYLAEEVSRIKGVSFEELAKVTTQNAKYFFDLK